MLVGDEVDAMWDAEMIEQGREDTARAMRVRPAKTRCPICRKLFKCVEAHSLIKHGKWLPPQWPPAEGEQS